MIAVDSPLPSAHDPPPPRSGVPLALAELCGWGVHEIEIAVSLLRADRADTNAEACDEVCTAIAYVDRLVACVAQPVTPPYPQAPRAKIAELVGRESLLKAGELALYSIAIWRWSGQVEELLRLRERLQDRALKLGYLSGKGGAS